MIGLLLALVLASQSCGDVRVRVVREARRQGVDADVALALAWRESRWTCGARSSAGAVGPLQVIPRHWCPGGREAGCDLVAAGIRALAYYRRTSPDWSEALCRYNAGTRGCAMGRGAGFAASVLEGRGARGVIAAR